ncbi:MAG TPA: hypothetical protein VGX25_02095 [Actinophytocola sp.]|uniref:hypothetical protein n=1 Tax=Actinophytocola sp. TaxID=1872138 RepID=UPI002DDDB915|nr:hypothetical protein [Actinophytocola sp.]HEV2778170.1 hypothetical protein [Actinophytocola sp.]
MAEPIEANYVPEGDDWTITVSGRGKKLTAKAPGIIAARDRTDQLVEQLAPDDEYRTVVHLLNGDAVQFTTAYLTARMTKSEPTPAASPDDASAPDGEASDAEPAKADRKPARKTPSPRAREADSAEPTASPS